ncbi:GTPase HflX [Planctomicrobium piriforme]|uniref:GTPase HflX n=1 Tax=Planctomicrobium piriforme TaxID=1576369 RepID=A0A1I3JHL4_9PLAN|nr:GTPase HflX [Planctomicrobium piriforme]SFI59772.1 GTP-binding protein HflX [Planctomicrobium piriforme]
MGEPQRDSLKVSARKCILVAVREPDVAKQKEQVFDEIKGLVKTASSEVVGTLMQARDRPDPASYLGKGKLLELKDLISATGADLIVFDNHLSPSQGKHIEEVTKTQVVDRSEVILDIFATHARSYESQLQVELAQLLYLRPRLTRMWTHLERIEGGIGSGRGPGEKQLETDRRLVDKRIDELKRKLKTVEHRRELQVASRTDHVSVSLVGYTNAGKSTLMNALTGADIYVADQLFATLDTRTRKWKLPRWGEVLLSDTVGFIRDLPHHLVASFKSTLAEARHADLLLHVVDASHPQAQQQIETVNKVLEDVGVDSSDPILVLNKIDAAPDRAVIDVLRAKYPGSITVSAIERTHLDQLSQAVSERLSSGFMELLVTTNVADGKTHSFLIEHAEVVKSEYQENQVTYEIRIPKRFAHQLEKAGATLRTLDDQPFTFVPNDEYVLTVPPVDPEAN